jgi:endonuclease/exonuclease/phosphatase family metal-dependent hydrolase
MTVSATEDGDGSLRAIGATPDQAVADLDRLQEVVRERQPEQGKEWKAMLERHLGGLAASGECAEKVPL